MTLQAGLERSQGQRGLARGQGRARQTQDAGRVVILGVWRNLLARQTIALERGGVAARGLVQAPGPEGDLPLEPGRALGAGEMRLCRLQGFSACRILSIA